MVGDPKSTRKMVLWKNGFDRLGELEFGRLESVINSNNKEREMRNSHKNKDVVDRIMVIMFETEKNV